MEPWLTPQVLITLFGMIATIAIAFGTERQARKSLEDRHVELAKEARGAINHMKTLEDRNTVCEKEITKLNERVEGLRTQMTQKASTESVDSLREAIGRIEGKLDGLTTNRAKRKIDP